MTSSTQQHPRLSLDPDEWNLLMHPQAGDPVRLCAIHTKIHIQLTKWIRRTKQVCPMLAEFLQQATRSYRLHEVEYDNYKQQQRLEQRCMFSGLTSDLTQGAFIIRDGLYWKPTKFYVYKSVFGVIAKVCIVLGDIETFITAWKRTEGRDMEATREVVNLGVEFADEFLALI